MQVETQTMSLTMYAMRSQREEPISPGNLISITVTCLVLFSLKRSVTKLESKALSYLLSNGACKIDAQ